MNRHLEKDRQSLLYYLCNMNKKSREEAELIISRLSRYDDIYEEFRCVAFAFHRDIDVPVIVNGFTAADIRKQIASNAGIYEVYLILSDLRYKEELKYRKD
jgi:hypothetical protein